MRVHLAPQLTALLPEMTRLNPASYPADKRVRNVEHQVVEAGLKSQLSDYGISGVQPTILYVHWTRRGLKPATYVVFHL